MRSSGPHILVVCKNDTRRQRLVRILKSADYTVEGSSSGKAGIGKVQSSSYDAVVADDSIEDLDWQVFLKKLGGLSSQVPFIVITATERLEFHEAALRSGAANVVLHTEIDDKFLTAIEALFAHQPDPGTPQAQEPTTGRGVDDLIGVSQCMQELRDLLMTAGAAVSTVLITGESGTGKELAARAIHYHSLRAQNPFVPVNCGAITETLIESEFFGHVRGAFTGAVANKPGFFEQAHRGTLFLDEIGETSPALQVKLLRVLQEGESRRVGGNQPIKFDVRVVAATNRDLDAEVARGTFREDLYYRLNVIDIKLPPLRERMQDIQPLAAYFLGKEAAKVGRECTLSEETLRYFLAYAWPGNVRELESTVERGVAFAKEGVIEPRHLRANLLRAVAGPKKFKPQRPETGSEDDDSNGPFSTESVANGPTAEQGPSDPLTHIRGEAMKWLRQGQAVGSGNEYSWELMKQCGKKNAYIAYLHCMSLDSPSGAPYTLTAIDTALLGRKSVNTVRPFFRALGDDAKLRLARQHFPDQDQAISQVADWQVLQAELHAGCCPDDLRMQKLRADSSRSPHLEVTIDRDGPSMELSREPVAQTVRQANSRFRNTSLPKFRWISTLLDLIREGSGAKAVIPPGDGAEYVSQILEANLPEAAVVSFNVGSISGADELRRRINASVAGNRAVAYAPGEEGDVARSLAQEKPYLALVVRGWATFAGSHPDRGERLDLAQVVHDFHSVTRPKVAPILLSSTPFHHFFLQNRDVGSIAHYQPVGIHRSEFDRLDAWILAAFAQAGDKHGHRLVAAAYGSLDCGLAAKLAADHGADLEAQLDEILRIHEHSAIGILADVAPCCYEVLRRRSEDEGCRTVLAEAHILAKRGDTFGPRVPTWADAWR